MRKALNNPVLLSVTALGFSAIITQLILMREFLSLFQGNELVMGILLGIWLLLFGLGSYIGKHSDRFRAKIQVLALGQVLIAILPVAEVFLLRYFRNTIFLPGTSLGIMEIFITSFILLLPYCTLLGFILTLSCSLLKSEPESVGKIYAFDTLGDIVGGLLFSLFMVFFLTPFQSLTISFFVNMLASLILSAKKLDIKERKLALSLTITLFFIMVLILLRFNLDKISMEKIFINQELLHQESTPYGSIVVTQTSGQINFFENGLPLFSTNNTLYNEEGVHFGMLQKPESRAILLISGGVTMASELAKYNPDAADYVELDKRLTELTRRYIGNLELQWLNIINTDARLYIKQTDKKYDAVLINLPEPSTGQLNRYYSTEFFREVRRILNPGGIVSLRIGSSQNYYPPEIIGLNSAVFRSLSGSFRNVIVVPANGLFMIASDSSLSYDYSELMESAKIGCSFVNREYLNGMLTPDRLESALNTVREPGVENTDFSPTAYYFHLLNWMRQHREGYLVVIFAILFIMILLLSSIQPVSFSVLASGLSGASLSLLILFGYQVVFGIVYQRLSLIVTSFMIGIVAGVFFINKFLKSMGRKHLLGVISALSLFSFLLPFIMILSNKFQPVIPNILTELVFQLLSCCAGLLTGMVVPMASKLVFTSGAGTASLVYSADYLGAGMGAVFVSALLVPLLGVGNVCLIVGGINLIAVLFLIKEGLFRNIRFSAMISGALLWGYLVLIKNNLTFSATYSTAYIRLILLFVFGGLSALVFFRRYLFTGLTSRVWRNLSFAVFLPAVLYPLFRCFFRIPYLFCHVCPRRCIFGYMRPVLVGGALVYNLDSRFWCNSMCPLGRLQDSQPRLRRSLIERLDEFALPLSFFSFVIVTGLYFIMVHARKTESGMFIALFKNAFTPNYHILIIAGIFLVIGFLVRRPWCRFLCPVGFVSRFHKIYNKKQKEF